MPLVVGLNDLKPEQINRPGKTTQGNPGALHTTFFKASASTPIAPTSDISRYPAGKARYSAAHFHAVDQFQVIMEGKGTFGRHDVAPYCVHFSRAYTPYGPLQSDKDTGWALW